MIQISRRQIEEGLANDRFRLFGQPKWTFGRNTCSTYEVFVDLLVSEDSDDIPREEFIPAIEADERLTMQFGSWFLEKAFTDGAKLMESLKMELTISINVLAFQVNRPEFVERVRYLLGQVGIQASSVQFELSEAQPLNETGRGNLLKLKELGVGLVLGNFGTGYSNVDLLRAIPFDILELSRDFTAKITHLERDLQIAVAVLQMAQVLGIKVCAKGIETAEQMELLEEAGFTLGQGFLIGRPMPMDELERYVRKYAD